jgi:type II secretory pathway pseudopilin PulG
MFPAMLRREHGFTLLEICMAVVIALLVVGMAVPSVRGVLREEDLKKSFEQFDDMVRKAQSKAVSERRAYVLVWDKDGVLLEPYEPQDSDRGVEPERLSVSEGQTLILERPAAMDKKPAAEWIFWRSGVCEPAVVTYEGSEGAWKVEYNPLTARGTFLDQTIR